MSSSKELRQWYCPECGYCVLAMKGHTPVCGCTEGIEMQRGGLTNEVKANINPIKKSKRGQ